MHEYGIARDIVRQAVAEAQKCGATRINTLRLVLGSLEYVDQETLAFGIQAAACDTIAEGAELEITKADGKGIVLEQIEVEETV